MPLTTTCLTCDREFDVDPAELDGDPVCPFCAAGDDIPPATPPTPRPAARRPTTTAAQRRATRAKRIVVVNGVITAAFVIASAVVWHRRPRPAAAPPVASPIRVSLRPTTAPSKPAAMPSVVVGPTTRPATVLRPAERPPEDRPATQPAVASTLPAPSPVASADHRHPVPDAASTAGAERLIGEVFAAQRADPSPAGKRAFAAALLAQANDAASPVERYALLSDARAAAIDGGDPVAAVRAASTIGGGFVVDARRLLMRTLTACPLPTNPVQADQLAEAAGDVAWAALGNDDPDEARRALAVVAPLRPGLVPGTQRADRVAGIEAVLAQYDAIAADRAALAAHPDDPAANGRVAAFYLFVRHEWLTGVRLAARGDDRPLAAAAALELAVSDTATPDKALVIADAWWDAAAGRPPADAAVLRAHAAGWYRGAFPPLRGLARLHAARRLAEVDPAFKAPPPPIAGLPPAPSPPADRSAAGVDGLPPRRVVFLCDTSDASAAVFGRLRTEVERQVDDLTYDTGGGGVMQRFNVLLAGDQVVPLTRSAALRPATAKYKEAAHALVEGHQVGGSFNPVVAVRAAMAYRPDLVVLLTHGFPTAQQLGEAMNGLRAANPDGRTRVDCVYLPTGADPTVVAGLSALCQQNGGQLVTDDAPGPAATTAPTVPPPQPPVAPAAAVPRHVLFLCQSSGSMVGVFARLRVELHASLGALRSTGPDRDTFNVAFFSGDAVSAAFDGGAVPATPATVRLAGRFADQQVAAGGVRVDPVARFLAAEHADVVYLYSEGFSSLVADRAATEQAFVRAAGGRPIDCTYLQSGDDPRAVETLQRIAGLTGGTVRVVLKKDM